MSASNDNADTHEAQTSARLVREGRRVPRAEAEHDPLERGREERDVVGRRLRDGTHGP